MSANDERNNPGMGVQEEAIDCLQFHELEEAIDRLLEEDSSEDESLHFSSVIEENINYIVKTSNSINEVKKRFMKSYQEVNAGISDLVKRVIFYVEIREIELQNQLKNVAAQKISMWDRQLKICEDALKRLQKNEPPKSLNLEIKKCQELMTNLKLIDAGDLNFETTGYRNTIQSLENLGALETFHSSNLQYASENGFIGYEPKFTFGSTGAGDGQFCRPWGVCCDSSGRILICDRSNHRIQIFNQSGHFLIKFGQKGSRAGEFNIPSGIEVDGKGRIIVCDKDNHRIQVFTFFGLYMFEFGSQGQKPGQFNYPWDVAVNLNNNIAISDSKNNRVQLFSSEGVYITHFDFKKMKIKNPRYGLKILDSPRGLAFRRDGYLLVTDMNNHFILVLDPSFKKYSSFGREGQAIGEFYRPQGISVDPNGNFVVADSKNYRIQVFDKDGRIIKYFGNKGSKQGYLECPQGVCFHRNSSIIVVDLKNDRIQVY